MRCRESTTLRSAPICKKCARCMVATSGAALPSGRAPDPRRDMPTDTIYNYRKVDDRLITGGQPREKQFRDAANEGFTAVINLAPYDERYSIDDEPGLV